MNPGCRVTHDRFATHISKPVSFEIRRCSVFTIKRFETDVADTAARGALSTAIFYNIDTPSRKILLKNFINSTDKPISTPIIVANSTTHVPLNRHELQANTNVRAISRQSRYHSSPQHHDLQKTKLDRRRRTRTETQSTRATPASSRRNRKNGKSSFPPPRREPYRI